MSSKEKAAIMSILAAVASFASVPVLASGSEGAELETTLTDTTGTEFGEAEFRSDDVRMRLEVEAQDLEGLGLSEGDMLSVFVAGEFVTDATLDNGGGVSFDVELDTDDGGVVPDVMDGDMVEVTHMDTVVLSGTFMPEDEEDEE